MQSTHIVFTGKNRAELVEESLPDSPAPGTLHTRCLVSGVSAGTEMMWYNGTATALVSGRKSYPYRPGYACIGEVTAVGEGATGFAPGDRVFYPKPHGQHHVITLSRDRIFRLPDSYAGQDVLMATLATTALNALRRGRAQLGEKVTVVGFGLLGFLVAQIAKNALGAEVTVLARNPDRHRHVCEMHGLALTDTPAEAPSLLVLDTTGAQGGIEMALQAVASNGRIVCAGFYAEPLRLDGETLFVKEFDLLPVRAGGSNTDHPRDVIWSSQRNLEYAVHLITTGKVTSSGLQSEQIDARHTPDWYASRGTGNKASLLFFDWTKS